MPHHSKRERTDTIPAIAAALIQTYRMLISPVFHQILLLPGGCRFSPSCSAYGRAVIRQYGLRIGFMFLWRRIIRCHPWSSSAGFNPVP